MATRLHSNTPTRALALILNSEVEGRGAIQKVRAIKIELPFVGVVWITLCSSGPRVMLAVAFNYLYSNRAEKISDISFGTRDVLYLSLGFDFGLQIFSLEIEK